MYVEDQYEQYNYDVVFFKNNPRRRGLFQDD